MPVTWFHYWKAPQVRRGLEAGMLDHIASNQFGRVDDGDRVWIVNATEDGELITMGFVDATQPVSMAEARRRLTYEPWDADYHIIVPKGRAQRARIVRLHHLVEQIRFDSTASDRLHLRNGRVNGQQMQTMRRLTPDSALLVAEAWRRGLEGQDDEFDVIDTELREVEELLGELDQRHEVAIRREQGFLRRTLFGADGAGTCALCGREYPVALLVAAHIKRRAECDDTERRDYTNNVAPMCVLGCDSLFERGYLLVKEGIIRQNPHRPTSDVIRDYLASVIGRRCEFWNSRSATYFRWHAERHRRAE